MKKHFRFNLFYFLIALLGVIFLHNLLINVSSTANLPYSEFQRLLEQKQIDSVHISGNAIRGNFRNTRADGKNRFVTLRVDKELADQLYAAGITFNQVAESTLLKEIFSWVAPILFFFILWSFLFRRLGNSGLGGQFMSIGKSKAKVYVEDDTKVTLKDVAGVDEAKAELDEIISFLKDPDTHSRLGGRMPKGILLVGPPGTGKTLLARAVAGEAGVPFFSISGSEFVEMFVGVGAARVRDLFEQARQKAPCIIFIDELDALGRARSGIFTGGGHDEKEQTLNQLLVELDGFDSTKGTVLLGATNRPEILDPALLRAGRFDRQVLLDKPDKIGRKAILEVHIKKIVISKNIKLEDIAALTPGFTGADLANLVNEAALAATRRNAKKVAKIDFDEAIERILAGLERKSRVLTPFERKIVSYHEMGHALVSALVLPSENVHKVSIIPRGIGALGYTIQRPTEDRHLMTKEELENKMTVLMAGRAAEKLIFNHLSTGAADDITKATDIARSMVSQYGMDEKLGSVVYEKEQNTFLGLPSTKENYSEESSAKIDNAVKELLEKALLKSYRLLELNRDTLEKSSKELLETETLGEDALTLYFKSLKNLNNQLDK